LAPGAKVVVRQPGGAAGAAGASGTALK